MHFNQFCYLDFHLPNTLHTLSIQKVTYNEDTVTHCLFMDRLYILSPLSVWANPGLTRKHNWVEIHLKLTKEASRAHSQ